VPHLLQLNLKGGVELRHRSLQHHGAARRMLLYDAHPQLEA